MGDRQFRSEAEEQSIRMTRARTRAPEGPVSSAHTLHESFRFQSDFDCSADRLFGFHERPEALQLLTPPWQKVEFIQGPASLAVGTRVLMRMKVGPLWQAVEAVHVAYEPGVSFSDQMVKGPFAYWLHKHIVKPLGETRSRLIDDVTYRLPLGALGALFGGWYAERELNRLFRFRHEVTRRECT